ncbi:MAG: hypothetical protein U5K38_05510, partial [Woeseiaceae bacterium]|nr:hypothetical protein [Woeseiaceae bacterium]
QQFADPSNRQQSDPNGVPAEHALKMATVYAADLLGATDVSLEFPGAVHAQDVSDYGSVGAAVERPVTHQETENRVRQ